MSVDTVFKGCEAFLDDKLLQELGQGLDGCQDDDLQKLFDSVDIEASISTDDLIGNLPDDLEIPIFDGGVQDVFKDDIWKDGSDGSDSGIDCLSIKHEPLSPASSHCSDFSSDSQNSQTNLMDYSPTLTQFSEQSETSDLFSQFDLSALGGSTDDPMFMTTSDHDLKSELPDTPPLTPHLDLSTVGSSTVDQGGVTIATEGLNNTVVNSHTARAITFVTNKGSSKNTVTVNAVNKSGNGGPIKVVLPVSHTQNGRIKKIVNTTKVKIQPRPVQSGQQQQQPQQQSTGPSAVHTSNVKTARIQQASTLPQGKPLVLTPEEFAKLTAQGVLKLESRHSSSTTATTTKVTMPTAAAATCSTATNINPPALNTSHNTTAIATTSLNHTTGNGGPTLANSSMSIPAGFPVTSGCGPVTDLDLKSWKRQQRMIKNRESACLSRKRKKEYLSTVEDRLHEFTHQNEKLKSENLHLKRKLEQVTKENEALRTRVPGVSTVKKAAISLLAVALFLTLNLSPLTSILNTSSSGQSLPSLGALPVSSSSHHSRHLMSLDDSSDSRPALLDTMFDISKTTYNINDIEATVNAWRKSMEFNDGGVGLNSNNKGQATSGDSTLMKQVEKLKVSLSTMCPMYYNSTDSKRLMSEITGWFLGQKEELRRKELDIQNTQERQQQRKVKRVYHPKKVGASGVSTEYSEPSDNAYELQVFTGPDNRYKRFMDAIHRRNDTFYVVSFRRDQLLLPATATNNSMGRPRMSLVMPAMGLNETMQPSPGNIAMMQIDCEVMATNVLHIEKAAVPEKMVENGTFFVPPTSAKTSSPPAQQPQREGPPPGGKSGHTQAAKGHLPREKSQHP